MTDVVMMNSVAQALRVLLLPRGGRPEILEHLVGKFICEATADRFLPSFSSLANMRFNTSA